MLCMLCYACNAIHAMLGTAKQGTYTDSDDFFWHLGTAAPLSTALYPDLCAEDMQSHKPSICIYYDGCMVLCHALCLPAFVADCCRGMLTDISGTLFPCYP